jgi:exopolysaccharide biosynthesis polyprenyl glycosylphosphotransferase
MLDRVQTDQVAGLPLVGLRGPGILGFGWALKRTFDLAAASLGLLVLLPLLASIALAVRLSSRGPVLYRQRRIGLRGRPFTLLKFRSMRVGSDPGVHRRFADDWVYGRSGQGQAMPRSVGAAAADSLTPPAVHKLTRDPRVTPIGRVLRRSSLDELPQLWNVLRGEMSIVGPRPAVPYEVERYSEWHKQRLGVLPGITGLWQVSGRNLLSFEEMVRLDIQYIENWSLELDARILLRTLPALFRKAY